MVNIHKVIFTTCLLLTCCIVLSAQNYVADVKHYGTEDGLSHRQVNDIHEGSDGFIWIGTNYGLNRFDGHNFRIFTKEKHGLLDNEVHIILEDNEGWLWLMTMPPINTQQISLFNIHTHEVKTIAERFGPDCPFLGKDITNAIVSTDKKIYISLEDHFYQIDDGIIKKREVRNIDRLDIKSVTKDHKLLGLNFIDSTAIELLELDTIGHRTWSQTISYQLLYRYATRFFEDAKGIRWLFLQPEIFTIQPGESTPQPYKLPGLSENSITINFVSFYYVSPDASQYWYKDNEQLIIASPDGEILLDLNKSFPEITKNSISNIAFDSNNNAWITTSFGFYNVQLYKSSFTNYLNLESQAYDLQHAFSTRGIGVRSGKMLVNSILTRRYVIDLETGDEKALYQDGWLKNYSIRPIYMVDEPGYYMGGNRHLIHAFGEDIQEVFHWKKGANSEMIWSIHKDKLENIWMGILNHGLAYLDKDSITNFKKYNDYGRLATSSIYSFLQWDAHHILIASTSGIYILHTQHGIIQRFWMYGKVTQQLPFDLVNHLYRDEEEPDIIWAATGGGGLLKITLNVQPSSQNNGLQNFHIKKCEQFTVADGLSHNTIYAIYPDAYQNLWLSSDYGIICFNKPNQDTRIYTTTDGLPFNEFNRIAHFQDQDGRLYFGTMNGVTSFHPDDFVGKKEDFDIPLIITKYQKFDGENRQLVDHTPEINITNKISLKPEDQFFTLEFALLEFKNAALTKYSYKIDGQGDDWIYIEGNSLRISGLPYGNFNLHIRAQGAKGQFSTHQLSIPIQVLKPFYRRNWFIISTAALSALCILLIFRTRTRVLKTRQTELEQQVAERTAKINSDKKIIIQQAEALRKLDRLKSRFFTNISHELRTPLTLILTPIEDTIAQETFNQKAVNNLLIAQRNGKKLQKKINEILDLSKLEAGALKLQLEKTNWLSFLKNTVANFESIAKIKGINFTSTYDLDTAFEMPLDVNKTEIVLENLLSNAFKFTTKGGSISLTSQKKGDYMLVQVEDSGRGIHPDDLPHIFDRFYQSEQEDVSNDGGTGIGLAIVKEFTQLMGGTIQAISHLGEGSTFSISLPIHHHASMVEAVTAISDSNKSPAPAAEIFSPITIANNHLVPTLLIVEDNPDLQALISNLLSTQYNIINVFNGEEAVSWLSNNQNKADLVLSDIMMPVMDGYQLLEILKTAYPQIPVIMLTAKGSLDDKLKALRIGVDDYITKPFAQAELKARIENLLKNAQSRQSYLQEEKEEKKDVLIEEDITSTPLEIIKEPLSMEDSAQQWLAELEEKTLEHCGDYNYTVEELARSMTISTRQLTRRMKITIGLTPGQYLKTVRLNKARQLLSSGETTTVKATAVAVGYRDVNHFSRAFHKEFGKSPSDFLGN